MTTTLYPTSKKTREGYVPMVTVRGALGRMYGSRAGGAVYSTAAQAKDVAREAALRVSLKLGAETFRVPDHA